jgi:hypothetical protein
MKKWRIFAEDRNGGPKAEGRRKKEERGRAERLKAEGGKAEGGNRIPKAEGRR